jgi:hypothetical protein
VVVVVVGMGDVLTHTPLPFSQPLTQVSATLLAHALVIPDPYQNLAILFPWVCVGQVSFCGVCVCIHT